MLNQKFEFVFLIDFKGASMFSRATATLFRHLLCLIFLFSFSSTLSHAFQVTGTLTGTVADPSGAVVPGATVVMKNAPAATSAAPSPMATDSSPSMPFSQATIQSRLPRKVSRLTIQKGVHFDTGDKRNLSNIALKVGASTETVTVSGTAEELTPVDSGEKSVVIGQQQLQNIAIVGQNAAEFIKLLPGFALTGTNGANQGWQSQQQSTGAGPVGNFSANGLRTGALDITSDGAHIIDPGCNCGQAVNTVSDMTSEMKVLTSNFGAENAKGPVVIAAIGKSGGNQFHGEAYLYARDATFDATNAYNNELGTNPEHRPEICAEAGHLLLLSRRPNRRSGYDSRNDASTRTTTSCFSSSHTNTYAQTVQDPAHDVFTSFVPTADMRNGNFSQSYLNSYLGGSNPGGSVTGPANQNISNNGVATSTGIIPASSFSPIGANLP